MAKKLNRLLLSLTSNCNLRCRYCYVFNEYTGSSYIHQTMTPFLVKKTIKKMFDTYDSIGFIQFFGGEPNLVLGLMKIATEEIKKICQERNLSVPQLGIITNLTLLNDEIIDFYKENNLKITVSMDGPKEVHDYLRKYASGKASHKDILTNIERLKKRKIPFSVECTFTKIHVKKEISVKDLLDYFSREIKPVRLDIVCVMDKSESELNVYDKEFPLVIDSFVEAIDSWFDYWKQGGEMIFGIIAEVMKGISFASKKDKLKMYCPAGDSYLAVSPNGNIYPCHLFLGNNKYLLGKIDSQSPTINFNNRLNQNNACRDCPTNSFCFSCLGRNEFFTGYPNTPYKYDCLLKQAITKRIVEILSKTK